MRIICLANSYRDGGRCVAGINPETGAWVRPIPPGGGMIPEQHTRPAGRDLALLDVVEINVDPPRLDTKFQRENHEVRDWEWRVVGRVQPSDLLPYCDDASPLFFTFGERVNVERLERESPQNWQSLRLIGPQSLEFEPDERDGRKWRAAFLDAADDWYSLRLTDPVALRRLDRGCRLAAECLLTVSLCEPWFPPDDPTKPPACYKIAAAVIEL
jgi:hypothetical protein